MEVQDQVQEPTPAILTRAIQQWERGNPISLTLATELLAEGFDVEALEAKYRI